MTRPRSLRFRVSSPRSPCAHTVENDDVGFRSNAFLSFFFYHRDDSGIFAREILSREFFPHLTDLIRVYSTWRIGKDR